MVNMMKKIFIVDPFETGHHRLYLHQISMQLQKLGYQLHVVAPFDKEVDKDFFAFLAENKNQVSFTYLLDGAGGYQNKASEEYISSVKTRWKQIEEQIFANGYKEGDLVFLTWMDSYISSLLEEDFYENLKFDWVGFYFQPMVLDKRNTNFLKKYLNPEDIFRSKSCKGVLYLTDCDEVESWLDQFDIKSMAIPDFTDLKKFEVKEFKAEILEKSKGKKLVGLFGSLARRKGIFLLLSTIEKYKLWDKYYFVIAGQFIEEDFSTAEKNYLFNFIRKYSDSFFFHPARLASDGEFNGLIDLVDFVFGVYDGFYYSSNMPIKSAFLKKKLLVRKNTYVGDLVERFRLGDAINYDEDSLYDSLMDSSVDYEALENFVRLNTTEVMGKKLEEFLNEIF